MSWRKESSYGKWWEDDVEVVPSAASAGSWEGAVLVPSAAAAGSWETTETSAAGAWEEVPLARPAGSAETPGRGSSWDSDGGAILGLETKFGPINERKCFRLDGRPIAAGQFHRAAS